jgi:arginase family enzyme
MPNKFLNIDAPLSVYENSKFVIVPVPIEETVSYGKGTAKGPAAILKASQYLEDYDIEQQDETCKAGISVVKAIKATRAIKGQIERILNDWKVPVMLGG